MSFPEFGPFAAAFESTGLKVPGYLTLLNFGQDDALIVIDRIAEALRCNDSQKWVTALFDANNWRPHLVGAIAILLDQRTTLDVAPLWSAIDAGTWVTPQLVATAYFSDPAFASRALKRMNNGCPVTVPAGLDPLMRHVATGPAGTSGRSGKMAASILAVSSKFPSLAIHESTWRADPKLQPLLDEDQAWDGSEEITKRWMAAVTAFLLGRGIKLSPPIG
jgi:hypothetical protein